MKNHSIAFCIMMSMGLQIDCMDVSNEVVISPAHWIIAAEIFGQSESESVLMNNSDDSQQFDTAKKKKANASKTFRLPEPKYTLQDYLDIADMYKKDYEKKAPKRTKRQIAAFLISNGQNLSLCSPVIKNEIKMYADQYVFVKDRENKQRRERKLVKITKK